MITEKSVYISIDLVSNDFWNHWPSEKSVEEAGLEEWQADRLKNRLQGILFQPNTQSGDGGSRGIHLILEDGQGEAYRSFIPFFGREHTFHSIMSNFTGPDSLKRHIFLTLYGTC